MNEKKSQYPLILNQATVTLTQREQENLKVTQRLITAFSEGHLQEMLTYLTDDVEFRVCLPEEIPMGGLFRGPEGVLKFFENHKKLLDMEWEKHEHTLAQGDVVVIIGRERARIMPHGRIYEEDFALSFTFRDGKISKFYGFGEGLALLKAYRGE